MDLPKTSRRVIEHSPPHVNRKIQEETLRSIEYHRKHPNEVSHRVQQLDKEWNIERVLEANAVTLILAGLGLGLGVNRKFLVLPTAVSVLLLQYAWQGWCPPISLLRRRGWRTQEEIETERMALLDLRQSLH